MWLPCDTCRCPATTGTLELEPERLHPLNLEQLHVRVEPDWRLHVPGDRAKGKWNSQQQSERMNSNEKCLGPVREYNTNDCQRQCAFSFHGNLWTLMLKYYLTSSSTEAIRTGTLLVNFPLRLILCKIEQSMQIRMWFILNPRRAGARRRRHQAGVFGHHTLTRLLGHVATCGKRRSKERR